MATKEFDFKTKKVIDPNARKAAILIKESEEAEPILPVLFDKRYRMLGIVHKLDEALELLRKHKVGILFLDQDIEGIDVKENLEFIQRKFPGFEVAVMSGNVTKERLETAINNGAIGYLKKPLDKAAIQKVMSRMV